MWAEAYRVAQIKRRHFTILLVTNECIYKSLRFLAHLNYIKQQMARCQFYVNECVTRQVAPRATSAVLTATEGNKKATSNLLLDRRYFRRSDVRLSRVYICPFCGWSATGRYEQYRHWPCRGSRIGHEGSVRYFWTCKLLGKIDSGIDLRSVHIDLTLDYCDFLDTWLLAPGTARRTRHINCFLFR